MNKQTILVAKNVYRTRVKGAGYWAMILTPLLIPLVSIVIGLVVTSGTTGKTNLAVVNEPKIAQELKQNKILDANVTEISSQSDAAIKLEDGKIDGYLSKATDGSFTIVTTNKTTTKFNEATYQQALTQIKMVASASKLGLSPTDLTSLLRAANLKMTVQSNQQNLQGGDTRTGANIGLATATSIIVMILLMFYVTIIAQEVANEKSSRIMETLLATTSSNTQYYGKIIGVIGLALTQIVIYAIGFGVTAFFLKDNSTVNTVISLFSGVDLSFGVYAFLMIISGILGYIFLASIIASLVNEQSQVQQATQPLAFFSLIGYIAGIAGAAAPGNVILRVLSYIPFISPTLMTSRLAIQYSSQLEAWIAFCLQVIATILVAKAGEKIYARNVLSYSSDKIMSQFFQNLRGNSGNARRKKTVKEVVNNNISGDEGFMMRRVHLLREQPWRLVVLIIVLIILFAKFIFFK